MTPLLREPLVHFLALGAAIFALFAAFDDAPPPVAANRIEVTEADARRLAAEFEAIWRRRPGPEELELIIDRYVREEVYVREALALGLDRGDAAIRQRLHSKMVFLTESGAELAEPDDATLEAHLEVNAERFSSPTLFSFEQIRLADDAGEEEVAALVERLAAGGDHEEFVIPSLLPSRFEASPPQVIDAAFGPGFIAKLENVTIGEWVGPVASPRGRHLVRMSRRTEPQRLPLAEIRDRVAQDWRSVLVERLREERFAALLARYQVVRPDMAAALSP